ncbi:MAG: hypothetical protein EBT12_02610 [Marivivens sp.]|nr:hypothetical protein [Marivivens sp.]
MYTHPVSDVSAVRLYFLKDRRQSLPNGINCFKQCHCGAKNAFFLRSGHAPLRHHTALPAADDSTGNVHIRV